MVAGGGALGHGVQNHVGRFLGLLCPPVTGAGGPVLRDRRRPPGEEAERLIRTAGFEPVKAGGIEQSGRLDVGGDRHDRVVGPAEARSLIGSHIQGSA